MNTVIIGNSGSGKTWLAMQLASRMAARVIHLDEIFWAPGGFDRKRSAEEIAQLIAESRLGGDWIVEGVFGELARLYLEEADCLLWLDLDWDACKGRLIRRGSESKRHLGRKQSEEGLRRLIEWAEGYLSRSDLRSREGHEELFTHFQGNKVRFRSEASVNAYLLSACAWRSPA